ncbi:hypothetical protein C6501_03475 [Candidatus Poribacteria bacterium]|nr:MAG: hypothetical protein C6501_03475 [Candidatus Poribacteria bacterium]
MKNLEKEDAIEDKNKRSSIFTVKDAENTILWFSFYVVMLIVCVILHQRFIQNYKVIDSLYFVVDNISKIIAASTLLIILGEGADIMLRRFREHIRREKEMIAEARAEAKAEVYREVAAWDRRRKEAEARGVEFNEPPPTQESDQ